MWNLENAHVFERLIAPLDIKTFAEQYYEIKPVHIARARAEQYRDLFDLRDVDEALHGVELPRGAVRVCKNGAHVPAGSFLRKMQRVDDAVGELRWMHVVDARRVAKLVAGGATLVFDDLVPYNARAARLARSLESFFRHRCFVSLFLTPAGARGFAMHYDLVDSFVLQIHGRKRWKLWAPSIELPLEHQKFDRQTSHPGAPLFECSLQAGDLLYMPRGTYHEAQADGNGPSLHLTIGAVPIRWSTVFAQALLEAVEANPALRATASSDRLAPEAWATVRAALSQQNLGGIVRRMEQSFCASHMSDCHGLLGEVVRLPELGADSTIELRRDLLYELVASGSASVRVRCFNEQIDLPEGGLSALSRLAQGPARVGDLAPDQAQALGLAKRFIAEGLAVAASEERVGALT